MPLTPFNFIKSLNDLLAFPKPWNRATFQKLHDETQAYINNSVVPLVNSLEKIMPRYYVDSGAVNAIVITPNPAFTDYTSMLGIPFHINVANKNTGAVTLNVNNLGPKSLLKNTSDPLVKGDIPAGCIITVMYDGTAFQITSIKRKNPSCKVSQSGSLSVANSVDTAIPFVNEDWDTDNIHDTVTNNTRLTCVTPGDYLVTGKAQIDQSANGMRWIQLFVNGANIIAWKTDPGHGSTPQLMSISGQWRFNAGDYVELKITQSSGGALNVIGAQLGMVKLPD